MPGVRLCVDALVKKCVYPATRVTKRQAEQFGRLVEKFAFNKNDLKNIRDENVKKCIQHIRKYLDDNKLKVKATNVHVSTRTSPLDVNQHFVPISITGYIDAIVQDESGKLYMLELKTTRSCTTPEDFHSYLDRIKINSGERVVLVSKAYNANCLLKFKLQCMFYMQMYYKLYNYKPEGIVLIASPAKVHSNEMEFDSFTNEGVPLQLLHMQFNFLDRCVKYRGFSMTIGIKAVHERCKIFKLFYQQKINLAENGAELNPDQSICVFTKKHFTYGLFVGSEKQINKIIADSNKRKLVKLKQFLPLEDNKTVNGFFIFYKIYKGNKLQWRRLKIKI